MGSPGPGPEPMWTLDACFSFLGYSPTLKLHAIPSWHVRLTRCPKELNAPTHGWVVGPVACPLFQKGGLPSSFLPLASYFFRKSGEIDHIKVTFKFFFDCYIKRQEHFKPPKSSQENTKQIRCFLCLLKTTDYFKGVPMIV